MFKNLSRIKYYQRKKGMTLVELVVVLAIFALITGLVMYDYGSFKSTTSTQNLANDIALSIRKAQSYAIGVRGLGDQFKYGHGIHFSTNPDNSDPASGSNKSFVLFTDFPENDNPPYIYYGIYDSGDCTNPIENECQEILTINGADKILGFYFEDNKNRETELNEGELDITFLRPNPDARFCYKKNYGDTSCLRSGFSNITILVSNGREGEEEVTREITVWSTGQIGAN